MANEQGHARADNLDIRLKLQCRVAMAMKVFLCASWGGSSSEGETPACHVQSFLHGWHLGVAFLGRKAQKWW